MSEQERERRQELRRRASRGGRRTAWKHVEYKIAMDILDDLGVEREWDGEPLGIDSRVARLAGEVDALRERMRDQQREQERAFAALLA